MDLINALMVPHIPKIKETTFWCFHFFPPEMGFAPTSLETKTVTKHPFSPDFKKTENRNKKLGAETVTKRNVFQLSVLRIVVHPTN